MAKEKIRLRDLSFTFRIMVATCFTTCVVLFLLILLEMFLVINSILAGA